MPARVKPSGLQDINDPGRKSAWLRPLNTPDVRGADQDIVQQAHTQHLERARDDTRLSGRVDHRSIRGVGRPGKNGGAGAILQARPDQVLTLISAQWPAAPGEDDVGPQAMLVAEQQSSRDSNAFPPHLGAQEAFERAQGADHRPSPQAPRANHPLYGDEQRHLLLLKEPPGCELLRAYLQETTQAAKGIQQSPCTLQLRRRIATAREQLGDPQRLAFRSIFLRPRHPWQTLFGDLRHG